MEKFQSDNNVFYEWPSQSLSNNWEKRRKHRWNKNEPEEKKESTKEMIWSLQNIFCKGRYRSWDVNYTKESMHEHK